MSKVIVAVYRGNVIIPLEKLNIPPGTKLRIRIEGIEKKKIPSRSWAI